VTTAIRFGAISLDCPDPHALAEFYAGLLGVDIAFDSDAFSAVRIGDVWLSMQKVADHTAPTWPDPAVPQQLHLDFAVDDLEEGERIAIASGARKAPDQPSPERWRVMIDPAGHPFCLSSLIPE
jgi:hypothetical protein